MTLNEFMLARIAEDEAEVVAWPTDGHWGFHPDGGMWMDSMGRPIYAPRSRVMAECEAKRLIVVEHPSFAGHCDTCHELDGPDTFPCRTLRALALPYAAHSDYVPGWKP